MLEIDAYLGSTLVIDRVNSLIGRKTTNSGVEEVDGAVKVHAGFDYVSRIQRLETNGGITAYKAEHRFNASKLWERGIAPDEVLKQTHSLEAIDYRERVVLEASTSALYLFEDDWLQEDLAEDEPEDASHPKKVEHLSSDIHLVRGGLVFSPDAIPRAERARMVKLFGL